MEGMPQRRTQENTTPSKAALFRAAEFKDVRERRKENTDKRIAEIEKELEALRAINPDVTQASDEALERITELEQEKRDLQAASIQ